MTDDTPATKPERCLPRRSSRKPHGADTDETLSARAADQSVSTDSAASEGRDLASEVAETALRNLFRQAGFAVPDGMNEYDRDYTAYTSLGNTLTHEMRRALRMLHDEVAGVEQKPPPSAATGSQTVQEPGSEGSSPRAQASPAGQT